MENCANLALQIADQKTALDKWKQQKSSREGLLRSQPRGVRPGQRALRRGVPACPFRPRGRQPAALAVGRRWAARVKVAETPFAPPSPEQAVRA